jgi:CheY-like chemotaxis protein
MDRLHVLVVDDLADMADSAAELLTLWGYDATACASGALALTCARARRPDAVLLDLAMPHMDGFQLARALHELPGCEAVPLVAVSGYNTPAHRLRARQAGVTHYLVKPTNLMVLQALLASVTQIRAVLPVLRTETRSAARPIRDGPRRPTSVPLALYSHGLRD